MSFVSKVLQSSFLKSISKPKDGMVTYVPKTPGLRHRKDIDFKGLGVSTAKPKIEGLYFFKKQSAGRNSLGRITVRGKGGGMKKIVREVDFCRNEGEKMRILQLEKDPWRSGFLALIEPVESKSEKLTKKYIIATDGMKAGGFVQSFQKGIPENVGDVHEDIFVNGNCFKLRDIPIGREISAISMKPEKKAQLCRSAGSFAILQSKSQNHAQLKLKSGEVRLLELDCHATIGRISNLNHHNVILGKAGRNRALGRKSKVRGVAMNPVDHPHGGGERRGKGIIPQSRTGVLAKGGRTRNTRKSKKMIVKERPRGFQLRNK
eukprot:NODE_12_length_54577_cov_0.384100.p16 type:complete len:319 gc:universal NODE_12_length_54577_cov_0.384100:29078-30034(+)